MTNDELLTSLDKVYMLIDEACRRYDMGDGPSTRWALADARTCTRWIVEDLEKELDQEP